MKAKAAAEAEEAQQKAKADARREALRPLVTVLRQAHERFPKLSIFNDVECGYRDGWPHVYTGRDTIVELRYDLQTRKAILQQQRSGFGYFKQTVLAESVNVEELIPVLVGVIAALV